MTEQDVVRQFRRKRPKSVDEILEQCGVGLQFVASGAFRKVYKIADVPIVVKLPTAYLLGGKIRDTALEHARQEYSAYQRVMRSKTGYKALQPHMPEVFYFNVLGGIMLMREYQEIPSGKKYVKMMDEISRDVETALGDKASSHEWDLGSSKWDNYGLDRNGTLKIIDMGLLLPVVNGN